MKTISVRLDEHLLQILDRYAKENKMTRSEVIRRAIIKMISSEINRNTETLSPLIKTTEI